ncbi:MAG: Gfo/Idh/MocA family oxidoreductase [Anaerolineae bacterium]|nr:Gfo/Idh/MocA family oxidoreductase [Anaerolineae bacterium]
MGAKVSVGIIGCGAIAPAYIRGCTPFDIIDLAACADIDLARAQAFGQEYGIRACSVSDLLADPDIQIVLNLTVPNAHAEVALAVIQAGKHVYSEKPLAITRDEGQRVMAAAQAVRVRVGCAPDTFLGGGIQTCRKLIDDGAIGDPVAAIAFMAGHGPESWHPNPAFYYQRGGGPLFDMGPYYLTALVNLLGPIRRVTGTARTSFPERIATSEGHTNEVIPVEVPTHYTAALDFAAGPVATLLVSFDVWAHHLPRIEIYGSEGSLSVPDPNTFRGPVQLWRTEDREWRDVPLTHSDAVGRGTGVADMAYAIRSGRLHRASGELALHVVDVMQAVIEASDTGQHITLTGQVTQPAPLPVGLPSGELDQ